MVIGRYSRGGDGGRDVVIGRYLRGEAGGRDVVIGTAPGQAESLHVATPARHALQRLVRHLATHI